MKSSTFSEQQSGNTGVYTVYVLKCCYYCIWLFLVKTGWHYCQHLHLQYVAVAKV